MIPSEYTPADGLTRELLEPCPFCGASMHLNHYPKTGFFGPDGSHEPGCVIGLIDLTDYADEQQAIAAWNTRSSQSPIASSDGLTEEALSAALNMLYYIYETTEDEHARRKAKEAYERGDKVRQALASRPASPQVSARPMPSEREAIVAWLRHIEARKPKNKFHKGAFQEAAAAIEAGDHLKPIEQGTQE